MQDWWQEEREAWEEGRQCVAGIDEAGRGPLAGPVVAACVVLPFGRRPDGLNDSKQLTPRQREVLFESILLMARGCGLGVVSAPDIDRLNILRATHLAMRQALDALPPGMRPDLVLIDGLPVRPFPLDQVALVKGDSRSASIAAASILAKVTRDRLMCEYDALYPMYGFAGHKGYGAASHLRALAEHGPCPIHRRSFRPIAEALRARTSDDGG